MIIEKLHIRYGPHHCPRYDDETRYGVKARFVCVCVCLCVLSQFLVNFGQPSQQYIALSLVLNTIRIKSHGSTHDTRKTHSIGRIGTRNKTLQSFSHLAY